MQRDRANKPTPPTVALDHLRNELLGQDLYTGTFVKLIIIATLYTALLMAPIHMGMRWAFGGGDRSALTPMRLDMVE